MNKNNMQEQRSYHVAMLEKLHESTLKKGGVITEKQERSEDRVDANFPIKYREMQYE
jgi:hypothetical protein